jgi:hypothetical protein
MVRIFELGCADVRGRFRSIPAVAYSGGANRNPFPDRQHLLLTTKRRSSIDWSSVPTTGTPTGYNHCIIMITGPGGRILLLRPGKDWQGQALIDGKAAGHTPAGSAHPCVQTRKGFT